MGLKAVRNMDPAEIEGLIGQLLVEAFWLPSLDSQEVYERYHDDHDGRWDGKMTIAFTPDGDAYVSATDPQGGWLRFRTQFSGGGQSPRVRVALQILARAVQLDNQELPQDPGLSDADLENPADDSSEDQD